ncbi:MAG TPA: hypothetical protein DIS75_05130 [Chryseobacterium sp.]|nr:hypothetical protein [Flavobacteriales bacterium]MCA0391242.1 hypothetical protein [Bacteroidota bacterium]HCN11709.1 hypothetical protein [Chryseobacterium sp.]
MARKYNYIYSKLVEGETDLIGLVAYGLYKNNKIEYLQNFKKKNNREPFEEELDQFNELSCTESSLQNYVRIAETNINDLMNETIYQEVERQKSDFYNNQTEEIKNIVKELKPKSPWEGFGMRILQSFIASILVASIIFLIIFIIKSSQEGLINTLKYFINKN